MVLLMDRSSVDRSSLSFEGGGREYLAAMSSSTDWAGTSAKYRALMEEWKKAGRASRKEDDALWARFRAAQQVFFDARRAKDEAADAEFAENLKVKEAFFAKGE